jgi:outer membrane biogenesis lipoprotein LolB
MKKLLLVLLLLLTVVLVSCSENNPVTEKRTSYDYAYVTLRDNVTRVYYINDYKIDSRMGIIILYTQSGDIIKTSITNVVLVDSNDD